MGVELRPKYNDCKKVLESVIKFYDTKFYITIHVINFSHNHIFFCYYFYLKIAKSAEFQ